MKIWFVVKIQSFRKESILKLRSSFLIQNEGQDVEFQMKKFFTPSKSFLPPLASKMGPQLMPKFRIVTSMLMEIWGSKKLLWGKKLLLLEKYRYSCFSWRKNQVNCIKTRSCEWLKSWVIHFIFWNQNGRHPLNPNQIAFSWRIIISTCRVVR